MSSQTWESTSLQLPPDCGTIAVVLAVIHSADYPALIVDIDSASLA
jgi:hypothetical protein